MNQRRPRIKDDAHLDFVRQLACIVCGDDTTTEAAHIRYSDARAGKRPTGKAEKPHDRFALPLCGRHHRAQHNHGNERLWWASNCVDPIFYALALYGCSGDHQTGSEIIRTRLEMMQ